MGLKSGGRDAPTMNYVRLRAHLPEEAVDPVHEALMAREAVTRVHLLSGGVREDDPAYIYYVEGDHEALADALAGTDADELDVTSVDEDTCYVYLKRTPSEVELAIRETFTSGTLVATLPVVYHGDGSVSADVVGASADVQAAVDAAPVEVDVEAVGEYAGPSRGPALTDRQREVLQVAREVGYYDVPRSAGQDDVADELGVAPGTVAEHLRKAEARLVDAALDRP